MSKHPNCAERCRLVEDKGYRPCEGPCFYSEPWPLVGFNAVMAVLEGPDCGAVHSGVEDMGDRRRAGRVREDVGEASGERKTAMSDTPRTDAVIHDGRISEHQTGVAILLVSHARQLERELGRAKASLATLAGVVAERDELREELRLRHEADVKASVAYKLQPEVIAWLRERLENCRCIAATKESISDKAGWLEDARFFEAVLVALASSNQWVNSTEQWDERNAIVEECALVCENRSGSQATAAFRILMSAANAIRQLKR